MNFKLKFIILVLISTFIVGCSGKNNTTKDNRENLAVKNSLDYSTFKGLDMEKSNITINVEGKELKLKLPIYIDKNRYYLPLNEIVENIGGEIKENNSTIDINLFNKKISINTKDNTFTGDSEGKLKKKLITEENLSYISLYDFSKIFNLTTRWNGTENKIKAYVSKPKPKNKKYVAKIDTPGFIRLEDIAATNTAADNEYFERLRIIGSYLGEKEVPYHIAWAPRFVIPANNSDEDPSKKNSIYLADLVYTLDYLSDNGGVIGLHGYTHQSGEEMSLVGTEFGIHNPSIDRLKERVEAANQVAKDLDIPIGFFEAPHYAITLEQEKVLENYFDYMFQPYIDKNGREVHSNMPYKSPLNNKAYYLYTPLDYVPKGKIDHMLKKIKKLPENTMAGLFYHPDLEKDFIKFTEGENGYPDYEYSNASNIKKIVDQLEVKGYKMMKITDIK